MSKATMPKGECACRRSGEEGGSVHTRDGHGSIPLDEAEEISLEVSTGNDAVISVMEGNAIAGEDAAKSEAIKAWDGE